MFIKLINYILKQRMFFFLLIGSASPCIVPIFCDCNLPRHSQKSRSKNPEGMFQAFNTFDILYLLRILLYFNLILILINKLLITWYADIKIIQFGPGKMTQQLKAHTALPEDLSSIPHTHLEQLTTTCSSSLRESMMSSSVLPGHNIHIHRHVFIN